MNSDTQSLGISTDIRRKAFHLLPAVVIIALWIVAISIWEEIFHQDIVWGISGEEYGIFLIITVGYTSVILFAALDYIRLSYIFKKRTVYHLLPGTLSRFLLKTLKKKELHEFTKPVALVLSFVPIFFLPMGVFTSAALIASLGDAASSLLGIKFGKVHFPRDSKKTVVGYLAGTITSFLTCIFSLMFFEAHLGLFKILILSLVGAITYLLVDLVSLRIDDNISNPLACGLVIGILYFMI